MRNLTPFLISFTLVLLLGVSSPRVQAQAAAPAEALRTHLLAVLARDLTSHFNLTGDLQLELLRPWVAPEGVSPVELEIAIVDTPGVLTSNLLLRVRFSAPSLPLREETLSLRAQVWRDVWVLRSPTERGSMFEPDDCDIRRVDALRERESVPTTLVSSGEWMYSRAVPAGRLLTWRDLSRRALVRKGEIIEVAAVDGVLQVVTKAVAMQDGAHGETVRVRNLESKRDFAAVVTAENRAQVRF